MNLKDQNQITKVIYLLESRQPRHLLKGFKTNIKAKILIFLSKESILATQNYFKKLLVLFKGKFISFLEPQHIN